MKDLDLAKQLFNECSLSLVIVKNGKVLFKSKAQGIHGLLQAIDTLSGDLRGSSVVDKIVGRAAALLLVHIRARAVYAAIASRDGLAVLEENDIPAEYDTLAPQILDKTGKNICPFEKASQTIRTPDEAPEKLRACMESLRKNG